MSLTLDLHGFDTEAAIARFVRVYNRELAGGARMIDVIHGYGSTGGEAIIRRRLRRLLRQHSEALDWLPGEDVDANPGHSLVEPRRPLPEPEEELAREILDWCHRPRTMDKLTGRFRRHGQPAVKAQVTELLRRGLLGRHRKGAHTVYLRVEPPEAP